MADVSKRTSFFQSATQRTSRAHRSRFTVKADASKSKDSKALVVVGSINADMVLQVERLPKEGETLAASNLTTFPGGKVSSRRLLQCAHIILSVARLQRKQDE